MQPVKYKQITFEKENGVKKPSDKDDRYTVYVDNNKFGEHLRFDELIRLLGMIEESGEGNV